MTGRPYILAESTWGAMRQSQPDVAILPWGATEAHNYHLPYATDNIESEAIAIESARLAWERGARVIVLPTIPFGVNTGQRDIRLCINMNPSTQAAVLRDVARSVAESGVGKLVVLNGHGGNDFKQMIRELQGDLDLLVCQLNWYSCIDARAFFDEPGDHAGELETSLMLHVAAELVRPLADAGPGDAHPFRVRALREGWAWTPRHWARVTPDTGVGNPAKATREKGAAYFQAVTAQIADFLEELARVDITQLYG
jgi:creatinine amidohydrolase